jgi:hypothetical protein
MMTIILEQREDLLTKTLQEAMFMNYVLQVYIA